jgi:hypothetical protein
MGTSLPELFSINGCFRVNRAVYAQTRITPKHDIQARGLKAFLSLDYLF